MKTATEKIQLFKPDAIARKIGGDIDDALTVLRVGSSRAVDDARQWLVTGDHAHPWPMMLPERRGDALVDFRTLENCESLHAVTVGAEDLGTISKEAHLQAIRRFLLHGGSFERRQFFRDEIARWLAAVEMKSEYDFDAAPAGTNPAPQAGNGTPAKLSAADKDEIPRLYNRGRGQSVNALSKHFGVSRPVIDKVLKRAGVKT